MSARGFSSGGGRRRARRRQLMGLGMIAVAVVGLVWLVGGGGGSGEGPSETAAAPTTDPLTPETTRASGASTTFNPAENALAERNARALDRTETLVSQSSAYQDPADEQAATRSTPAAVEMGRPLTPIEEPAVERPAMGDAQDTRSSGRAWQAIEQGESLLAANRPIQARDVLNRALYEPGLTENDRGELRARLSQISEMVTFSPRVYPGDPMADTYVVRQGDALSRIPAREGFRVDYRLIQRLNKLARANQIRIGQRLKALYGPFHAVVDKSDFRMDIYADQTDTSGNRIYIRSFQVGLGEYGSTPVGSWMVTEGKKLVNPSWANPRTGERFAADDPKNPIGERWIALTGTDSETSLLTGYGIHGTIEPGSIGREESMGCVRLLHDDIVLVYELLVGGMSEVEVVD